MARIPFELSLSCLIGVGGFILDGHTLGPIFWWGVCCSLATRFVLVVGRRPVDT